jgi:hypothetical protein
MRALPAVSLEYERQSPNPSRRRIFRPIRLTAKPEVFEQLPSGAFLMNRIFGGTMPQNDFDYELSDPYLWWQRSVPLRIVVRSRGPGTLSSDDRVVSDASDDQSAPGQGPGASYFDQTPTGSSFSGQGLLDFPDRPAAPFAHADCAGSASAVRVIQGGKG